MAIDNRIKKEQIRDSVFDSLYAPTDITHANLLIKIAANGLIAGSLYKITDFTTKHRINGTAIINEGPPEPLIIKALTSNVIDVFAISTIYPKDIIKYDINNVLCEDNTTARKGFIFYRKDPILNNEVDGYDFRNVVFKKGRAVAGLWSAATAYMSGAIVKYDIGGVMRYYILVRENVAAGVAPVASPTTADVWDFLFNETDNFYIADGFQYWINRDFGYQFNPAELTVSTTDIKYFYTFNALGHDASNGNYNEFKGYGNVITNDINNDGLTFFATNNGSGIYNNDSHLKGNQSTIHSNSFYNNKIEGVAVSLFFPGSDTYWNILNWYGCISKGILCRNTIPGSYLNYYGGNVTDNIFAIYSDQNILRANFQWNRIGIGGCTVGHTFQYCNIRGMGASVLENGCQYISSTTNIDRAGITASPIKLISVQFSHAVSKLYVSTGVILTRVIFNTAITNKTIPINQTDVTVYSSPDSSLWAHSTDDTGHLTTEKIV